MQETRSRGVKEGVWVAQVPATSPISEKLMLCKILFQSEEIRLGLIMHTLLQKKNNLNQSTDTGKPKGMLSF